MVQVQLRRRRQFPHHQHCTLRHSPPIPNTTLPVSHIAYLWILALLCVTCSATLFTVAEGKTLTDVASSAEHQQVFKRSATEGGLGASGYPDYQAGVRYDEYPVSKNRMCSVCAWRLPEYGYLKHTHKRRIRGISVYIDVTILRVLKVFRQ